MKVSVVSATYNRAELLDRALATYARQTMSFDEWEYVLVDDCSDDNTREIADKWREKGLNIRYFHAGIDFNLPKVPGQWRDGCKLRNAGSVEASGQVLIMTHPEILVPPDALEVAFEALRKEPTAWVTAIPYWMPPMTAEQWPADWEKNLVALNTVAGFYDPSWPDALNSPGAPDYRNQNQEHRRDWESEVWWGMMMARWRWLGGFREFEQWGSVDMDFVGRRRTSSTPTLRLTSAWSTAPSKSLMVYHQHHDSMRDMDKALEGVRGTDYSSLERMREQGGLYCIYQHGPRERSMRPGLEDVLLDHRLRYQFAAEYVRGKVVLDVPCGTGYGATFLAPFATAYVGVDRDTESIQWAHEHHRVTPNADFLAITVPPLKGLGSSFFDFVVSFEGIEHIEDQPGFVAELARVMRPGATFILSTPQKGATPGTAWDRYMLTQQELAALFAGPEWRNLDWFHQIGYGGPHRVQPGCPESAPIMILGGTRI